MENTILELEKTLFKYEYMSNKKYLNKFGNVLDDALNEFNYQ